MEEVQNSTLKLEYTIPPFRAVSSPLHDSHATRSSCSADTHSDLCVVVGPRRVPWNLPAVSFCISALSIYQACECPLTRTASASIPFSSLRSCALRRYTVPSMISSSRPRFSFVTCPTMSARLHLSFSALNSARRPPTSLLVSSSFSFFVISVLISLVMAIAAVVQLSSVNASTQTPPCLTI